MRTRNYLDRPHPPTPADRIERYIRAAVADMHVLTPFGLGSPDFIAPPDRPAWIEVHQRELFALTDEIGACLRWFDRAGRTRNPSVSSYLIKHLIEHERGSHVHNGCAIVAAHARGFAIRLGWHSANPLIGVAARSIQPRPGDDYRLIC